MGIASDSTLKRRIGVRGAARRLTAALAAAIVVAGFAAAAEAAKKAPPIAAPMYLTAYANMVTRHAENAVKPLKHLASADPELADVQNALALALIASDPTNFEPAFKHARQAVSLAPDVPQFVVTSVITDPRHWKFDDDTARLTAEAAQTLLATIDRLKDEGGNAKRLAKLLKSIEKTGDDPEFPYVFPGYDKLIGSPNLALTRPDESVFNVAQQAIVEKVYELKARLEAQRKAAEEEKRKAEQRQREIERQVAEAAEKQRQREEAKRRALAKLEAAAAEAAAGAKRLAELERRQELSAEIEEAGETELAAEKERLVKERRKAVAAEDAARQARDELELLSKAEEEARKEREALKLAQELAEQQVAEADRKAREADEAASASMEELLQQIAEQEAILDALLDEEPPIIQVASAPDVVDVDAGSFQIHGVVGDEGGALRELIVNGEPQPLFKLDSGDVKVAEYSNAFRINVTPSGEGVETVMIEAVDAAGNRATKQIDVRVTVANRPSIKGKNYALLIGNNDYADLPNLNTAVDDATALADVLKERYLFDDDNVRLLTNATRRDILAELSRLRRTLSPEDRLLLYYAGHGQIDPATDEGFWQPVDAEADSDFTWISNADVKRYLSGMPAKHILVIADSCFSGSLTRSGEAQPDNVDKFFATIDKYPSRKVISSGGTEPVADTGSGGHSVFAYYLIKTLRDNDKPYITSFQLYDRLAKAVTNNSRQTPEFGAVRESGDQGNGDFTFIRRDTQG